MDTVCVCVCVTHHTHDVGEDGAGGANQSTDDGEEVVFQQEALGTESPARVAVQHRDDHRHVSAPDGGRQGYTLWWWGEGGLCRNDTF